MDAHIVCEGDLVLVVNENSSPRGCWQLGRVLRALHGDDVRVRTAEVRTRTGTYIRPVVKLCLIESASIVRRLAPPSNTGGRMFALKLGHVPRCVTRDRLTFASSFFSSRVTFCCC